MEHIKADELTGIYDRVADIVPQLSAEVDEKERQVGVSFADDAPPRIAIWNRKTGCTAMPVGFDGVRTGAEAKLRETFDEKSWPMGDADAGVKALSLLTPVELIARTAVVDGTYGGKTSAVLVIRYGKIQAERYKDGHDLHTAQRTWSVAKSIAATLVGHSVQKGMVDVNAPNQIPQWSKFGDPRATITIDQMLRMASGLTSDTAGNRTDPVYLGGAGVAERSTSWPLLHKPGSRYRYANNDTMLAILAAKAQHRDRIKKLGNYRPSEHDFDPYAFFQKVGMTRTYAETDWQGDYILSSQVWTTARDLGRLGLLYLADAVWNGERLLPENWRSYVSSPSGPQPDRPFGYGASFWLMNKSNGIPADTFAGFGNRGQYLVIIPSLDMVIVRRGYDTRGNRFDIAAFTRAVVSAMVL